ncbi:MAG: vitamin B12 dependent-methionine synthase activation domain-containing protein [Fibrobacter sp.]|nr:vitamin B12 dependent-methionine synthase activation domain-containing protein [Fibrobacter sp.]
MDKEVNFLRSISIELPLKMIMMRLGYRNTKTVLSVKQRENIQETIMDGFSMCKAQGCWRVVEIAEKTEESVVLENGHVLKSKLLASLLKASSAVVFMASTVGSVIVDAATKAISDGDGAKAVIYDAVGGQCADVVMDWVNEYVRSQLMRKAQRLTVHRFSPGYGGLDLANQKQIYDLLKLDSLGLQLTERYMLLPEKSVTAIAGIESGIKL